MIVIGLSAINFSYPLYTMSFNCYAPKVHNYKSLASYKYSTAGWILDISWRHYVDSDYALVTGKVCHSYSSKTSLRPCGVIVRFNGSVVSSHCTILWQDKVKLVLTLEHYSTGWSPHALPEHHKRDAKCRPVIKLTSAEKKMKCHPRKSKMRPPRLQPLQLESYSILDFL